MAFVPYGLARPFLFSLDAETAHEHTIEMLARGVYMHPWHNMFLCAAMADADIDLTVTAAADAFAALAARRGELAPHPVLVALAAATAT